MTLRIVFPDMFEIRGLLKPRNVPVQMSQPAVNGRVSGPDVSNISLEVLHVDWIEAHYGGVEADISLCDCTAEIKERGRWKGVFFLQVGFDTVEGFEEGEYGFFIGFLGTVYWLVLM